MKRGSIFNSAFKSILLLIVFSISIAAQTTIVKGKLLDVNGKPSKYALVGTISSIQNANGKDFVSCDANENYSITLKKPGVNFLLFSIPSHNPLKVPVLNDRNKKLTIDVTLAPYKYKNNFDDVGVAGSFNDFALSSPEKMTKQEDGTYTYEVKTDQKEISYQLCNIEINSRTINAPGSESFEPDSSGDYRSIMTVNNGAAKIVFDPSKLLIKDAESKVSVKGNSYDKKISEIYNEYTKVLDDASKKFQEYRDAKKSPMNFKYDRGTYFSDLLSRINKEKNERIKDLLKLLYVSFAYYHPVDYSFEKATAFYESIPPARQAWEVLPNSFNSYFNLIPQYKWNDLQDKFLKETKSSSIKYSILFGKLATAKFSGNVTELKKIHELVKKDFADAQEAQDLLKRFPVESKIKVGAEIPDFTVTSLDNKDEQFSKHSMLGKIYMIDFWATWCGPCVAEMDGLQKAYDKFKSKGFEILSLSMDKSTDDVAKFRKEKYPMPWMNAFLVNDWKNKIVKEFEVIGIPRPILVDANGKILAMEGDLRGGNLEKTLSKYFK